MMQPFDHDISVQEPGDTPQQLHSYNMLQLLSYYALKLQNDTAQLSAVAENFSSFSLAV